MSVDSFNINALAAQNSSSSTSRPRRVKQTNAEWAMSYAFMRVTQVVMQARIETDNREEIPRTDKSMVPSLLNAELDTSSSI